MSHNVNFNQHGQIVLLLLGLDNAGKTVAAQNLVGGRTESVMPTVGFSVVNLRYSKYDVKVFDLGGRPDFRDVWRRYYVDAHGIIFVIDASDYSRVGEAHAVLENIVTTPTMRGKPLLVLANKADRDAAMDEIELIDKLELEALANENECPTFIMQCCAGNQQDGKMDAGIKIGFSWLIKSVAGDYSQLQARVQHDVQRQLQADEEERRERIERIQLLQEHEAVANGTHDVIVVQERRRSEVESISSTSTSSQHESRTLHIVAERPASATNLVRRQLELGKLQRRRTPLKLVNNKTTPVNLFGVQTTRVQSATVRPNVGPTPERRHLRSAGDSIFIVSRKSPLSTPNCIHDGSGDSPALSRPFNVGKSVLPPIDIAMHKLPNGRMFF